MVDSNPSRASLSTFHQPVCFHRWSTGKAVPGSLLPGTARDEIETEELRRGSNAHKVCLRVRDTLPRHRIPVQCAAPAARRPGISLSSPTTLCCNHPALPDLKKLSNAIGPPDSQRE